MKAEELCVLICVLMGISLISNGFIFGFLANGMPITSEEIVGINLCLLVILFGVGLLAVILSNIV
jgi:hypothetical protein